MTKTSPAGSVRDATNAPVKRSVRLLRVSSRAQTDTDYDRDPEGNSIDTQRKVAMAKERAMGTVSVGEYVEPGYSGQSIEKRPFFQEMLKRIIEQRDVDYVVIYMRSRIFRNYIEAGNVKTMLAKLGVRLVSAKEDFGDGLMGEAMEAVTDVFNWLQVRMSGEDIKIKMANKARNSGTIGRAKVGYLNQRILIDSHKVNTVGLDPERSHFIPMAFELFATGQETVASLRAKLTQAGFLMPATARHPSRPISVERLRQLLHDRYYLGYVTYEGIEYQGPP
jgi:site-specific DNA recombinase